MTPPACQSNLVTVAVRRVAALLNGGAGAFNKTLAADVESALRASFARHDVEADINFVDGDGLRDAVERARARAEVGEIDAVVIGGGDGSMRTAASVLAGTGVPLGAVPLGTLNHFAKDLGIPLQIEEAAATIAAGRTRIVDLAEVNGEIFINNSSIGIYPYMVIDRERRRAAHKLAKWMAIVPAFFRMMRHFPRRRLRISAEGFARPYRTPCLFVGNNEYGMDLFTFGRRQRLDSGELWFYVVKPRRPLEFFWMVCRLCFGRMDQARDLDTFQLAEAEISAKTSRLPVALDGEVRIMHTPLNYRSRPGALRVIVPEARQDLAVEVPTGKVLLEAGENRICLGARANRLGLSMFPRPHTSYVKRKLIEFAPEIWLALDLLAKDTGRDVQDLADEAFADLLGKYHRPASLKDALRESARRLPANDDVPPPR